MPEKKTRTVAGVTWGMNDKIDEGKGGTRGDRGRGEGVREHKYNLPAASAVSYSYQEGGNYSGPSCARSTLWWNVQLPGDDSKA